MQQPKVDKLRKLFYDLWRTISKNKVDSVIYGQVKEADDINKKLSFRHL
jgi:hypothetical protein